MDVSVDKPAAATDFARQTEMRTLVPRRRRHFPKNYEERAALGVRELRVPATWEEFLDLWETADYRVFYRDGHMISFLEIDEKTNVIMGEATIPHETLVMRFGALLSNLLDDFNSDFRILGSNAKIFIAEDRKGYNADVTVVKGEPEIKEWKPGKRTSKGITNPWLIVEILSNSTRDFDLSEKLADYKQIPSLQQIIFAEQGSLWASTYIRTGPQEWRNLDFISPTDKIPVADGFLPLARMFAKVLRGRFPCHL